MATDNTLRLRAIQPRLRPAGTAPANPARRHKRAVAKALRITPRRAARIIKAASR
jgi:hypothetical protein